MKNKINHITKMGMLLGLTAITALCMALPVHAGTSSAPGQSKPSKPPRGHGSGGGSGGGLPYATASTVSELIADINYANTVGGAITINLAPGASFELKTANNTTEGGNGLPVIGGTKAVDLTIIGDGATIRRIAEYDRYSRVKNPFRLFNVAPGASLTLNQVTLKGGWSGSGGAILNRGTLNAINGCILTNNTGSSGGGIYNSGGTVTVNDSTVSGNGATSSGGGIYNAGGTVTVNNSTLSGGALYYGGGIFNDSSGTVTVNNSILSGSSARFGGGICNSGGSVTVSSSTLSGNTVSHYDYPWLGGDGGGIYNAGGTVTVGNYSSITGNTADGLGADVLNLSVLYLDGTSTIGIIEGNFAISF